MKRVFYFLIVALILVVCHSKKSSVQKKPIVNPGSNVTVFKTHIDDTTICDLRVGWILAGEGEKPSVSNFETIDSHFVYHVFSVDGKELFSSSHFKKQQPMGCDESDIRTSWLLIPDTIYDSTQTANLSEHYFCLVIGCIGKVHFSTPQQTELSQSEKDIILRSLLEKDTIDSAQFSQLDYYSVGTHSDTKRFLVIINSSDTSIKNITAIIDIKGTKPEILLKDSRYQNETTTSFEGQADRDGDGLSDTFALDFGDYGGKWILKLDKGIWKIVLDNGPSPC